jgi:uncharacterized RDD family membrane protein YckC
MDAGPRALALVVDLALGLGAAQLIVVGIDAVLGVASSGGVGATHALGPLAELSICILCALAYFAIPTGIWGRTVGKLVCHLSVEDERGGPPGIPRALLREGLKLLSVALVLGPVVCLYQLSHSGVVWYDRVCRTSVEYRPPVKFSSTQKNFRKALREFDGRRRR